MSRIVGVIRQQAMQIRSLPRAMRGCRGMKRRMALTVLATIHKRFWLGESALHRTTRKCLGIRLEEDEPGSLIIRLPNGEAIPCPARSVRMRGREAAIWEEFGYHWLPVRLLDVYDAASFLGPGMVVLDIGGNVGTFSMLASQLVGDEGHVYAAEPVPPNIDALRKCIALNGLENVRVWEAAIGAEDGTAEMVLSDHSGRHSVVSDADGDRLVVPKRTIDSLVAERGVERVDFIKIDAEGLEPDVLRGGAETIAKFRPVIAAATYHAPEHADELPRILRDIHSGYEVATDRTPPYLEPTFWAVPRGG